MLIDVSTIPEEGKRISGEEAPSILGLPPGEEASAEQPILYDFWVQAVSGRLIVTGSLRTDISFACSRCAELFRCTLAEPAFEAVREFSDSHEVIDLTDEIREAIILAFPNYPVCTDLCKGLCPHCGTNLNRAACQCSVKSSNDKWSALDQLR